MRSNTSVEWEQCQWNIPGKETWSDSLKRSFEVTWVPLPGSTFTHVTSVVSAQRQREHLKWCQSRTPLWLSLLHGPRDTLSTLDWWPVCLMLHLPDIRVSFQNLRLNRNKKKPHVCHNPSRGEAFKVGNTFCWMTAEVRYDEVPKCSGDDAVDTSEVPKLRQAA